MRDSILSNFYRRDIRRLIEGIALNVVAPGGIETDFGVGRVRDNAELKINYRL